MEEESEEVRIENLPYSLPSKLTELLDGFKRAVRKKNTSVVIVIDGRSGMGKSTLSFQVAKYCDKEFGLPNVYFTPNEFLIGLSTAKPFTVHVFDEALLVSSRSAMSSVNRMIVQAMAMIRSKRIIVILNVNSIFDLDRNLALSRADILLSVYGDSLTDRGKFMAFFKGLDGMDRIKLLYLFGKKYYDYTKPKSNFFTQFPSHFVLDEDEYEKKKQEGVNKFLKTDERGSNTLAMRARDRLFCYLFFELGYSRKKTAEIGGVSRETVEKAIQQDERYTKYERIHGISDNIIVRNS